MKKIFLTGVSVLFVLAFIAGTLFAADEINVKGGLGTGIMSAGHVSEGPVDGNDLVRDMHIGAEYLHPINATMKVGGGLLFLSVTEAVFPLIQKALSWNYLPIYATFQINPFRQPAIFLKANLGFVTYAGINWNDDDFSYDTNLKGGIYFSVSIGREYPKGWFWEASFSNIGSSIDLDIADIYFAYNRVGAAVGYKFKLK